MFAREGARVMAAARRENRLIELRDVLKAAGQEIEIQACDAAKAVDMDHLAQQTLAKFGKVDFLVYVSGTNVKNRAMSQLDVATWDRMVSVNLNGAYYITQAVLPSMRERGTSFLP